jgi:heme exporter protein A
VSGTPLLALEEVACIRGGRLLFERISLTLEPGGAAVVAGPNGVGKSSLLRIAAGLLDASAGFVMRPRAAALADERLALDDRLTLQDALRFWSALDGSGDESGIEAMGLAPIARVPVRMLSTGQRKRAALARVIASGAPLWLLDEPANGLDAEGQERLSGAMAEHRRKGGAVLAASHQALPLGEHRVLAL